ncbi:ABC transporter substrate-binding protein [Mumia sp. DW29H23]|uniref:ABC transporter substrate-binding protein n=1 Tax=Mumia sp. DW29H23 TaxID=3421241 RepID=UPI003D697199
MTLPATHPTVRRRSRALAGALAAAALVLSACAGTVDESGGGEGSGDPVAGGTLRTSVVDPGGEVDPVTVASPGGTAIVDTVAEKLVRVDENYEASPVLATEWSVSDDGLTWTFAIREGVTFNDGRALTPADVVATFQRILAPDSTSPAKGSLEGVLKSVSASGKNVDFTLLKPFSDFPFLVAGSNTQILPADYQLGTWQDSYVGTGPFVVKSYQTGQRVTFEKNPTYWNKDEIYLDGIVNTFYKDQQARVLALQSGEIDGLYGEPVPANLTSAIDDSKYTVDSEPAAGFSALVFRVDKAPFDDVKVRQAIAWALDREAIVKTVYGGQADLGNDTIYGPTYAVRPSSLEQRKPDADKVKELLGDRKVAFTITTSSTEESHALLIQQQLEEYPNFDVDVDIQTGEKYYAEGDNSPWLTADATITYWASRPSPSQYIDYLYRSGAAWNASRYANAELDSLSDAYDASTDAKERQKIVDQIATLAWTDVPVIVTAYGNTRRYLDPKLHLPVSPGVVDYTGAWIDKS